MTNTNEIGTNFEYAGSGKFEFIRTLDIPIVAMGGHDGGVLYGISNTSTLIDMSPDGSHQNPVGPLDNGILSLALLSDGDGTMFGASYQDLYTINPLTAATTLIGHMGSFLENGLVGIQFDNFDDTLYLVEQNGGPTSSLYTVNTATGLASLVGPIGFAVTSLYEVNNSMFGYTADGKVISVSRKTGAGLFLSNETGLTGVIIGASSNAIPEPSSIFLAGLGTLALLAYRHRR